MRGTNIGKSDYPLWTEFLRNFISEKYDINVRVTGWPNRIEIYAQKNDME